MRTGITWGVIGFILAMGGNAAAAEIDPQIESELLLRSSVPVIVGLRVDRDTGDLDDPRDPQARALFLESQRNSFLHSLMNFRRQLRRVQGPTPKIGQLWLIDAITLNIDQNLLNELRNNPKIVSITLDRVHYLPQPREGRLDHEEGYTYGLKKFGLPVLREIYPDWTGEGVVAGVLDTGIDANHPDLQGKILYFKDFSLNPEGEWTSPADGHGHGTHVAGTIAGGHASGKAIGVAPGTKLVIGRIFDANGRTSTSAILNAMQWMVDPDEDFQTVEDVPLVVNNSWGGSGDRTFDSPLYKAVETWRKLQIFPCFAAGNSGPAISSVGTPGSYDIAFAVGATDAQDKIAYFSSRGPGWMESETGTIYPDKPEVSAPGVDVFSALPGGGYASWSGTSMATPHVTGAIVLLYQAYPFMTVERMIDLLNDSALDLGTEGFDFHYGFGRVNLLKAALDYNF